VTYLGRIEKYSNLFCIYVSAGKERFMFQSKVGNLSSDVFSSFHMKNKALF